jgi:hypothetical protein
LWQRFLRKKKNETCGIYRGSVGLVIGSRSDFLTGTKKRKSGKSESMFRSENRNKEKKKKKKELDRATRIEWQCLTRYKLNAATWLF